MEIINVLICYGQRRRPTKLSQPTVSYLKACTMAEFADILPPNIYADKLVFQIQDNDWGGIFVDLTEDSTISDRSIINVLIDHPISPLSCKVFLMIYGEI